MSVDRRSFSGSCGMRREREKLDWIGFHLHRDPHLEAHVKRSPTLAWTREGQHGGRGSRRLAPRIHGQQLRAMNRAAPKCSASRPVGVAGNRKTAEEDGRGELNAACG